MALFSEAGLAAAGTKVSNREKIKYLKRYVWLDREIDRLLAEAERMRSRLGKLTPTLSDMPGGGGGSIYKSADIALIDKIVDIEAEINEKIDQAIDLRMKIQQMVDDIDDEREKLLMQYRYLDGMTFEWIAGEMYYSWKQIHRLHSKALAKINIYGVGK